MKTCRLRTLSEQHRGKIFDLISDKYSVGRAEQRDICIDDPTISAYHCEFIKKDNSYWIKDCGSTNGARINNVPISGEQVLHNSDILVLGSVEMLYDCEEKTEGTSTVSLTGIDLKGVTDKTVKCMPNFSPFDKGVKNKLKIHKYIFLYVLFALIAVIVILLICFKRVLF